MSSVCRLCLNSSSGSYQEWKSMDRKYFEVVLPEIDLDMIKSSVLCSNCVELLRTAYLFKSNCLETERLIKSYVERMGNPENVSILDIMKGEFFERDYDFKPDGVVKIESNETNQNTDVSHSMEISHSTEINPSMEINHSTEFDETESMGFNQSIEMDQEYFDDFSDRDGNLSEDDKKFVCSICNIAFEDKVSLKRHKHSGLLRCGICNKDYTHTSSLRRHMLAHKKREKKDSTVEKVENVEEVDEETLKELELALRRHDEAYQDDYQSILLCEICRESFDTKANLLEHVKSHFPVRCSKENYLNNYHRDTVEKHGSKTHITSFTCDICFRTYSSKKCLLSHIRTHFEKPRCKSCDRTYYNIGCLKRHLATVHKVKVNVLKQTDEDNREFDDIDFEVDEINLMAALNKHLEKYKSKTDNTHVENPQIDTEDAKEPKITETNNLEMTNTMEGRPYTCEICNKAYNVKRYLDDHMKTHFCRPMCTLCNKAYYNRHCLKRHLSTVHKIETSTNSELNDTVKLEYNLDDPLPCSSCTNTPCTCTNNLKCNVCGKVMGNRSSFIRHKLIHSKRRNFVCDFCQKGFLTKLYLQRHINTTHLGVPRKRVSNHIFTCDTCGLTTNNKHTLIQHIRTHTGERPYKCDLCGKAFVQSSTLGTHKRTVHSTERLFTCEYCSKSFNTKGSLTKHILEVHMVDKIEKKFVCNFCGKKYRLQSQLTCHLKWHSSDRQFSCDICGKPFVDRHSVKKHRVIHFSEKQHKCEICGKGFHQKYNIKIHMKVHSRVP